MTEIEYPGVVQLIERVVWDHEAESLSLSTRTKIPLKSLISEGFFLFFVYYGAISELLSTAKPSAFDSKSCRKHF